VVGRSSQHKKHGVHGPCCFHCFFSRALSSQRGKERYYQITSELYAYELIHMSIYLMCLRLIRWHTNGICIFALACRVQNAYLICIPASPTETKQKGLKAHVLVLTRTHDAKGATCFSEYDRKMDGLGGLCNLLGGRALTQFACRVCRSGWRHLQRATVPPRDAFCICMPECMVNWAQPKRSSSKSIV
jgi:hypothetical protein